MRKLLADYQQPDPVFDWEQGLLWQWAALQLAERAIGEDRRPYALSLLEETEKSPYCALLAEKRQLLLAKLDPLGAELPNAEDLLQAKARQALARQDALRAGSVLDACENRDEQWHLLRGEAHFLLQEYAQAAEHFRKGEESDPDMAIPRLEECYRELEDYKMAYAYACKRR